ncbi:hypothetical protein K438DRAFT_1220161 [Mycena galopus ATCC 62051]|nr:hypothetical protein K438DRAFT_1220161 [Mycena galopus ATCC 62051]
MNFFLATIIAFAAVLSSSAAEIQIVVGSDEIGFSPTNVTANAGDTIQFQFQSKNHSVTQSTFANPCQLMTTPAQGIDSGFQFVAAGSNTLPEWSFTLDSTTQPLWFFCAQTNPVNHCQAGMVFSVNANQEETFEAFLQRATGNSPTSSSAPSVSSSSASTSTSPTTSSTPLMAPNPSTTPFNTVSPSGTVKKTASAGPIAGGVIGGLFLLAIIASLIYWLRRRRQASTDAVFARGKDDPEKLPSVRVESKQRPSQLERFSVLPTGETQLSPPPGPVPRGILVEEEKVRFAAAQQMGVTTGETPPPSQVPRGIQVEEDKARFTVAQQMGEIQHELRDLTEQAQVRGLSESTSTTQSNSSNAQLLDAIRMLGGQMNSLQQQIHAIEARTDAPPQYDSTGSS